MLTTGFTVVARPAAVECLWYSPRPELIPHYLSFADGDGQSALLIGRLYYREDQLRHLRPRVEERELVACRRSDAALARALYRTGGVESLHRLEGDFALVCHDRSANRLLALRDPLGGFPVFWIQQSGLIALSTSIRPLVDLLSSVELDVDYMADYLAFPTDMVTEMPAQHTPYRHVQRLLPGWAWEADLSARQVHCRCYWKWAVEQEPLADVSLVDAGALVRERLEGAVRERLSRRSQTASHLSGGFDSTGVALLASRMTAKLGQPLHAVSLVYDRDPLLAQEREYIEVAMRSGTGLVLHAVAADDLLDFDDHQEIPLLDEPWPMAARFRLVRALVQAATRAGADTVMTGDGADHFFAQPLHALIGDLVARGRMRQAWALATRYSYVSSQSAGRILADSAKLRLPLRMQDGLRSLLAGGRTSFEALTERTIPPWISRAFARRHRLRERILRRQWPVLRSGIMTPESVGCATGDGNHWHVGMPLGVTICRPYWDARVVALGLSLPMQLHGRPGEMKPVLAAALRDVLPQAILGRTSKALFGQLNNGLARNRDSLEAIVQLAPVPDDAIDRPALLEAMSKAALGIYAEAISVGRLRLTLSYLIWASQREAWGKQSAPVQVVREWASPAA